MTNVMRHIFVIAVLACSACGGPRPATRSFESEDSRLIRRLAEIDEPTLGLSAQSIGHGFLCAPDDVKLSGLMGAHYSDPPPAMMALIRRGADALPALLSSVSDRSPTELKIDFRWHTGVVTCEEYDERDLPPAVDGLVMDDDLDELPAEERCASNHYVVTVGDVCFVIIGQIVNRYYNAVRYMHTANAVINSPAMSEALVKRLRSDWGGMTKAQHEAHLVNDMLNMEPQFGAHEALVRLRFYYPDSDAFADPLVASRVQEIERLKR